jgi:anti-sigma28 factor (negative regulator of flagellin synthesis)
MPTFVIRNGEVVLKELAGPAPHEGKILGEAPMVISDSMSETRHMADGQYYTSKAAFRKATKAAGCVEVGNEVSTLTKARPRVQFNKEKRVHDIKQAIEMVRKREKRRR